MEDYYRVPTLTLLSLLVAVFVALYVRSRTQRRLLWLLGWLAVTLRVALLTANLADAGMGRAVSEAAMMLGAVMFLGAISPVTFGRQNNISYVIPFSLPLLFFVFSTSLDPAPGAILYWLNILAVLGTIAVGVHWAWRSQLLPNWFNVSWAAAIGVLCVYLAYTGDNEMVLRLGHSGISVLTGLLVLAAYRRLTPGVIFTASGFFVWSVPMLDAFLPQMNSVPANRIFNLMKVTTAVGMIVLVLEDEARQNQTAQNRDRRARAEMEQYARLDLSVEPHHDFGIQYSEVCKAISAAGRFRQVVILLPDVERCLRVVASEGVSMTLPAALDALGRRLSPAEVEEACRRSKGQLPKPGRRTESSFHSLLKPVDAPELFDLTGVYSIPISGRSGDLQGVLLLAGLKDETEPLLPEDLLPLELLVARVAAARESGLLLRRITRSEKLAGIGRLAGGVAHELNNPLTVVMGYAELIHESASEEKIRGNAAIIRGESQRMRQIIESLARFWKPSPSPLSPTDVPELLAEVESLRADEYERRGVRLEVASPRELPRIFVNADQMRQVLLQMLDNAAAAASDPRASPDRRVRLEASRAGERIHIVITDSGVGFPNPEKVFDPFSTFKPPGEGPGLALSLCYSIVREQGGDVSASNLQPYGAAMVIELPIEPSQTDGYATGDSILT